MTLSITTFNITTLRIIDIQHNNKLSATLSITTFRIIKSVIMLRVIMLNVANNPIMLSVVMVNVIMLRVVAPIYSL